MRRINRRTQAVLWTGLLALVLIAIYVIGAMIPEEAYASSYLQAKLPPLLGPSLGTDSLGRDLLMRTLKGLSISMTVGLAASAISAVIAVLVGIARRHRRQMGGRRLSTGSSIWSWACPTPFWSF